MQYLSVFFAKHQRFEGLDPCEPGSSRVDPETAAVAVLVPAAAPRCHQEGLHPIEAAERARWAAIKLVLAGVHAEDGADSSAATGGDASGERA